MINSAFFRGSELAVWPLLNGTICSLACRAAQTQMRSPLRKACLSKDLTQAWVKADKKIVGLYTDFTLGWSIKHKYVCGVGGRDCGQFISQQIILCFRLFDFLYYISIVWEWVEGLPGKIKKMLCFYYLLEEIKILWIIGYLRRQKQKSCGGQGCVEGEGNGILATWTVVSS